MVGPQVEIPVAGMQDTTRRLATIQTRDFQFSFEPEKVTMPNGHWQNSRRVHD